MAYPILVELDIPVFRTLYPKFTDPALFTDAVITQQWNMAILKCSPAIEQSSIGRTYEVIETMLYLLLCHLVTVWGGDNNIAGFEPVDYGVVQSASVGGVSVSKQNMPVGSFQNQILMGTSCGRQYISLLKQHATGGFTSSDKRITCANPILPILKN